MEKQIQLLKQRILDERDDANVMICTIEEMSELTKVLSKYIRKSHKFSRADLIEEMAHVLLQVDLLKQRFEIDDLMIQVEQLDALERCFNLR